jgi:hypothetical protein
LSEHPDALQSADRDIPSEGLAHQVVGPCQSCCSGKTAKVIDVINEREGEGRLADA